jgi:hypothetical protein
MLSFEYNNALLSPCTSEKDQNLYAIMIKILQTS